MRWYQRFFRRKYTEKHLDAELQFHLEQQIADYIAAGMNPDEARRRARLEFGGLDQVKEECRDVGAAHFLETLIQDLRYGLRMIWKNLGFTAVAVLTLALGIGANTAIFSVVYAVLLRPLPFKDSSRLVIVWATWAKRGENRINVSPADFADWKEQSRTLDHMAAMWNWGGLITVNGETTRIPSVRVTSDFFDLLGVRPARGRIFLREEQTHKGFKVVVISDSLWRKLGSDPALIGKSIQLNRGPWTVIGVVPPGFEFPELNEAWFPLAEDELVGQRRGNGDLQVIAGLKPGVSLAQAQSEMDTITARLREAYPQMKGDIGAGANVVSLREQTVGEVRRALLVLMAAVGCLLLIACANVANLMLARAAGRQREFALRVTLGASRWRVIRYLLTESTLLAISGGALGVAWAYLGVRAFVAFDPVKLPRIEEVAVNPSMLLFTLAVAIATGMLCGLAPALRCSRPNLEGALKEGSERAGGGAARTRARSVLAAAQIALSLVLLTSASLLLRSFVQRVSVPLGFRPEGVLAVELPWTVNPKIDELLDRLRALPGVQSAGAATSFPQDLPGSYGPLEIEGHPQPLEKQTDAGVTSITSDYFRAAGMTLREGRSIAPTDSAGTPLVAVVNEALVHRCFPGEDPIGKRIRRGSKDWCSIVGVVGNTKGFGVDGDPMPNIYFSRLQAGWGNGVCVLVRTTLPPSSLAPTVRKELRAWDKNMLVDKLEPVEDLLSESVTVPRFYMLLVLAFAGLAMALAAMGLYGLLNYAVAQRVHEIGVRMALGAERGDVLEMILRQGLSLILAGLVFGLAGAWMATRVLESLLFQIHPRDTTTFAAACFVLVVVGLLACYLPARRATKVDPMVALRYE